MPTYRFYNRKTGLVYEEYMMISEMEKLVKKKHIELLPPTQMNIVSSVGSVDSKTDSGFKEWFLYKCFRIVCCTVWL